MPIENIMYDKKSLRSIQGKTSNFTELAKDFIAFSNAQGGIIDIGIEDDSELPPTNQKINEKEILNFEKQITSRTINVHIQAEKKVAKNQGEYIQVKIPKNFYYSIYNRWKIFSKNRRFKYTHCS